MSTAAVLLASTVVLAAQTDSLPVDSVIRLTELTVTATRTGAAARHDQAEAISVVAPDLADLAVGLVVADLLREATGVHVQQTSAGQGAVVLRGLVGNQVLLLVDGVPLNNATYRDGPGQYLATVDPETIERIEVIRGPASVLYGSDAQGGVINLITRPHPFAGRASVHAAGTASSADRGARARVSTGIIGRRLSLGVGATAQSAGDLRAGGGLGPQTPTGFDALGADAQLIYMVGDQATVTAAVQHFEMRDVPRYDRYVRFRAPQPGDDVEHTFDPQRRQLAYARYTVQPRTPLLTRLDATASLVAQREARNRIRRLDSGDPDSLREHWDDHVYTPGISIIGSSLATLGTVPLALAWGGEAYHDQLASSGYEEHLRTGGRTPLTRQGTSGPISAGNFPDGANADRLGLFLSAETRPVRALAVSAGARWSWFRNAANVGRGLGGPVENTSADLTGQVGIVVAPQRAWRLALRVAEGFRAPNLYDLTRVGPVPGGISLPNPDAQPERSLTADLSARYLVARGAFDVTVYHTRIADFIDRAPGSYRGDTLYSAERVFQGLNVGTARLRGIEAEAIQLLGPVRLRATVQYTYGEQQLPGDTVEAMAKIPPLGGSASVRWQPPARRVWVEYLLRWATAQTRLGSRDLRDPRIPAGGTPGFVVHGIRAGAELGSEVNLSAGLENLTDELYRTHASGVDGPGRHVWVGVSWTGTP